MGDADIAPYPAFSPLCVRSTLRACLKLDFCQSPDLPGDPPHVSISALQTSHGITCDVPSPGHRQRLELRALKGARSVLRGPGASAGPRLPDQPIGFLLKEVLSI